MIRTMVSMVVVVLVFVAGFASVLSVSELTAAPPPVEGAVEDGDLRSALREIFESATEFVEHDELEDIYLALDADGERVGIAARGSGTGYGGSMIVLTGVDLDGVVVGSMLLEHSESRGFLEDVTDPAFRERFLGKSAADPVAIGEDIDGVSGATNSSRGYTEGVRSGLDRLEEAL